MDKKSLLEWYIEAGVDEAIDGEPTNYFAASVIQGAKELTTLYEHPEEKPTAPAATPAPGAAPLHHSPSAAMAAARAIADSVKSLDELEAAVRAFDGCAIKRTASKTVFSDGNPRARVMIIGEAPGAQEDVQGIPFCGPSGALLDRMLAAIGMDRTSVYISNTVFWRPPGNRQPSQEELATCLPFVEKHIALIAPALLILAGGTATTALLRKDASISRLRGKFYDYTNPYITTPIQTAVMYHPSYLLRTPAQNRLAWADLLMVQDHLSTI